MYDKLDLGMNVWTDASGNTLGTFNSYETFHAFSVGSGIDYYLRFNLGLTVKYVNSELIPKKIVQVGAEYRGGDANIVAIDYGIQVIWPVISTIKYMSDQLSSLKYKPFLNV